MLTYNINKLTTRRICMQAPLNFDAIAKSIDPSSDRGYIVDEVSEFNLSQAKRRIQEVHSDLTRVYMQQCSNRDDSLMQPIQNRIDNCKWELAVLGARIRQIQEESNERTNKCLQAYVNTINTKSN